MVTDTELAKLMAEEEMAKAVWLSCKRRLDTYREKQLQNKKQLTSVNRHIAKRMKQMAKTC